VEKTVTSSAHPSIASFAEEEKYQPIVGPLHHDLQEEKKDLWKSLTWHRKEELRSYWLEKRSRRKNN
jgi:hypothetical protein